CHLLVVDLVDDFLGGDADDLGVLDDFFLVRGDFAGAGDTDDQRRGQQNAQQTHGNTSMPFADGSYLNVRDDSRKGPRTHPEKVAAARVTWRYGPRRRRSLGLLSQFLEVGFHDRTILGGQAAGQFNERLGPFLLRQFAPKLGHFLDLLLVNLAGAVG